MACHPDRVGADGLLESVLIVVFDVTETIEAQQASAEVAAQHEAEVTTLRATLERLAGANRQLLSDNRELTDTVDRLREQGEELRQAAAAAQVAAEEIETLNEELQSSNEELETLHEEAQATVEELNVANDELHARAMELEELAQDHATEQARLSAVLGSMGDAVVVVDAQGRIMRTNATYDALVRMIGAPFVPADADGIPLPATQTPEYRVARGEAFQLEFTAAADNGTRHWFEATGRPLAGEAAGVLVIRDITDRTMRHLQEEFLTWAGHELRTPLTALQGYLQLAVRRLDAGADARLRRYLDLAVSESRRQSSLVAELLDATRLHSGRLELERAPLDLVSLAAGTVELAEVLTQGQALILATEDEPVLVTGDHGRLEQVLLNLLTNAVAHAPGTEQIDVRLRRDGEVAELTVGDTGPGIPVEALETIFDRFAQVNPSEKSGRTGLGLGLYIARQIVESHGGTISAHSAPGEGATFTVRLPLLEDAP
jgi:signal transduction histidine kinase